MIKLKEAKHIIDNYKQLNISSIIDLANSGDLLIHRTCIEINNCEIEDLYHGKAVILNKVDIFEKYEKLFIKNLDIIYDAHSIICYKYDEWPDKDDLSLEFFEFESKKEFLEICIKGLRENEFWGLLIDKIGLIFTMNFDLSIVLFYYKNNSEIDAIEAMFDNEKFLITRY